MADERSSQNSDVGGRTELSVENTDYGPANSPLEVAIDTARTDGTSSLIFCRSNIRGSNSGTDGEHPHPLRSHPLSSTQLPGTLSRGRPQTDVDGNSQTSSSSVGDGYRGGYEFAEIRTGAMTPRTPASEVQTREDPYLTDSDARRTATGDSDGRDAGLTAVEEIVTGATDEQRGQGGPTGLNRRMTCCNVL